MTIEQMLSDKIEKAHAVLLSMSVDQDNLVALGIFSDEIKADYEKLKNRLIGIYESNQQLLKTLPKEVKTHDF